MFWTARARAEYMASPLTLFGTLTFSPEMDVRLDAEMQLFRDPVTRQKRLENVFDLPAPELFRERVKFAGNEVTKWLKRLRSSDRSRRLGLRYLLVAEAHASGRTSDLKRGRPHFHCLIHQAEGAPIALPSEWAVDPSGQVRADKHGNPFLAEHAFLKRAWQGGFSSFAMCRTPQAAGYMLKYLTKEESAVRIRASFRYGANGSESIEPQAKEDISTPQQGEK